MEVVLAIKEIKEHWMIESSGIINERDNINVMKFFEQRLQESTEHTAPTRDRTTWVSFNNSNRLNFTLHGGRAIGLQIFVHILLSSILWFGEIHIM